MTAHGLVTQARLMQVIRHDPGIHVQLLAQVAGVSWSTCNHHVRRLEEQQTISRRQVGGRWCAYATDDVSATRFEAIGLLRQASNRAILEAVRTSPGSSQEAIASAVGMPPNTLCRRIRMLEQAGLLRRVQVGRERKVFPAAGPTDHLAPQATLLDVRA